MSDFQSFCRNIRLRAFFSDKKSMHRKNDDDINVKIQTKSQFNPNLSSHIFESFQQAVIGEVLEKWYKKNPKKYFKKEEWKALKE